MTELAKWFTSNLASILISLYNGLIDYIINPLISMIGAFFSTVADLLPNYQPTLPSLAQIFGSEYLAWLNWFLPFSALVTGFGILVTSYTARFVISPALRWFKLVR